MHGPESADNDEHHQSHRTASPAISVDGQSEDAEHDRTDERRGRLGEEPPVGMQVECDRLVIVEQLPRVRHGRRTVPPERGARWTRSMLLDDSTPSSATPSPPTRGWSPSSPGPVPARPGAHPPDRLPGRDRYRRRPPHARVHVHRARRRASCARRLRRLGLGERVDRRHVPLRDAPAAPPALGRSQPPAADVRRRPPPTRERDRRSGGARRDRRRDRLGDGAGPSRRRHTRAKHGAPGESRRVGTDRIARCSPTIATTSGGAVSSTSTTCSASRSRPCSTTTTSRPRPDGVSDTYSSTRRRTSTRSSTDSSTCCVTTTTTCSSWVIRHRRSSPSTGPIRAS